MRETRLYTIRRRAAEKRTRRMRKRTMNELYGKFAYYGGRTEIAKTAVLPPSDLAARKLRMATAYGRRETLLERFIRKMRLNSEY